MKLSKTKVAAVIILFMTILLSVNVLSKIAVDPETHTETIEALDEKKANVLKLTATSTAAATALAAVPGDSTTPVANKLADLSSYYLIILMVIFLEKYLITLTGYAAFSILVPIACALLALGICFDRGFLKVLAAKIAVFGLVIYFIIPISMNVSAMIEETYEISMETTIQEAEMLTEDINKSVDSEGNLLNRFLSKVKDVVDGFRTQGETALNNFIESVAVLMVTSCIIPVVVLFFTLWLIRMLFGIQINVPKDAPKKLSSVLFKQKHNSEVND